MSITLLERVESVERRVDELAEELRVVKADVRAFQGVPLEAVFPEPTPTVPAAPPRVPAVRPADVPRRQELGVAAEQLSLHAMQPPVRPPVPPREPGPSLVERLDLFGARGLAVVGGAVTALGIAFLFVLAARKGWIGPIPRVAFGGLVSLALVGAGIEVRRRFGNMQAAVAAVGAGIAGAYASLAAAAALYDLVPDGAALPLAGLVAAGAAVLAWRWRQELVAALGFVGASLAPALQAADGGIGPEGVAFATIVLAGTAAVALRRRWTPTFVAVAGVVGAQGLWLVADRGGEAGAATLAVTAALVAVGLAVATLWQLAAGRDLSHLAVAVTGATFGFALFSAFQLVDGAMARGLVIIVGALAWAASWHATRRPTPAFSVLQGAAAMSLVAVGAASLLSDDGLTLAWSAQAAALLVLAARARDVRIQVAGFAYLALAFVHAAGIGVVPLDLFLEHRVDASSALPAFAIAVVLALAAVLLPIGYDARDEDGPLAFLADIRQALVEQRDAVRLVLAGLATLAGLVAVGFLLVAADFGWGHLLLTALAAASVVAAVVIGAHRRSDGIVAAAFIALSGVLAKAIWDAFSVGELSSEAEWSLFVAAAGALAAGLAVRVLDRTERPLTILSGICAGAALAFTLVGALVISTGELDELNWSALGYAALASGAVYLCVAAASFRHVRLRNLWTTVGGLGVASLLAAEGLLVPWPWFVVTFAATAVVLLAGSKLLAEQRLWLAGAAVVVVAVVGGLSFVTPQRLVDASEHPARDLPLLLAAIAAFALAAATAPWFRRYVASGAAALGLYAVTLLVLEVGVAVSGASLETDFERAQTAVSAVWAILGLGLLVFGLLRASLVLRFTGLALFAVTVAKIFLYDLAELSSVARALSFIAVGALVLVGGFFVQRLGAREQASPE